MGGNCLKNKKNLKENGQILLQENVIEIINKTYNDHSKIYFNIINEKLKDFYKHNRNDQMNVSMTLDKKDFNTISSANKASIILKESTLNWKDYILKYLHKQAKKENKWAENLIK